MQNSPPSKKRASAAHRSVVWKFYQFPKNGVGIVICPKCPNTSLKFNGTTTSNILGHLQNCHGETYARISGASTYENDDPEERTQENAENQLAKSFVTGLVPFRFSENQEFRKFITSMPENFRPPNGSKIRKLIGNLATKHSETLFDLLKGQKRYTFLTDGYSDLRGEYHFYSLHILLTDENFKRRNLFCKIAPVGKGNAVTVSAMLNDSLNEFGLNFTDCSSMVSDAGSELVLTAQLQQLDRVHCGCHLLNLILKDFSKIRGVNFIFSRVQAFAKHLARNKKIREILRSLATAKGKKIKMPLPLPDTRWGALPLLLEAYLDTYEYALDLADLKEFLIKPEYLEKIRLLAKCTSPILAGILRMEREKSFCSEIIPTLFFIREQQQQQNDALSKKLMELTTGRLNESLKNKRLLCTMIIDHRFSFLPLFSSIIDWKSVENELKKYETVDNTSNPPNSASTSSNSITSIDLNSFLDGNISRSSTVTDIQTELNQLRVLLDSNRPAASCPLEFWNTQKSNFRILAPIARELLTTPASSAAAERTFSRCTDLLRQKKRNRTTVDTIDDLLTVAELIKLERAQVDARTGQDDDDLWDVEDVENEDGLKNNADDDELGNDDFE